MFISSTGKQQQRRREQNAEQLDDLERARVAVYQSSRRQQWSLRARPDFIITTTITFIIIIFIFFLILLSLLTEPSEATRSGVVVSACIREKRCA